MPQEKAFKEPKFTFTDYFSVLEEPVRPPRQAKVLEWARVSGPTLWALWPSPPLRETPALQGTRPRVGGDCGQPGRARPSPAPWTTRKQASRRASPPHRASLQPPLASWGWFCHQAPLQMGPGQRTRAERGPRLAGRTGPLRFPSEAGSRGPVLTMQGCRAPCQVAGQRSARSGRPTQARLPGEDSREGWPPPAWVRPPDAASSGLH